MSGTLRLLLPLLGAAALVVVALRSADDRLGQGLACVAVVCLVRVALSEGRWRDRARRRGAGTSVTVSDDERGSA